jgi:hypothetical protein
MGGIESTEGLKIDVYSGPLWSGRAANETRLDNADEPKWYGTDIKTAQKYAKPSGPELGTVEEFKADELKLFWVDSKNIHTMTQQVLKQNPALGMEVTLEEKRRQLDLLTNALNLKAKIEAFDLDAMLAYLRETLDEAAQDRVPEYWDVRQDKEWLRQNLRFVFVVADGPYPSLYGPSRRDELVATASTSVFNGVPTGLVLDLYMRNMTWYSLVQVIATAFGRSAAMEGGPIERTSSYAGDAAISGWLCEQHRLDGFRAPPLDPPPQYAWQGLFHEEVMVCPDGAPKVAFVGESKYATPTTDEPQSGPPIQDEDAPDPFRLP